jgi:hypothetical protein
MDCQCYKPVCSEGWRFESFFGYRGFEQRAPDTIAQCRQPGQTGKIVRWRHWQPILVDAKYMW